MCSVASVRCLRCAILLLCLLAVKSSVWALDSEEQARRSTTDRPFADLTSANLGKDVPFSHDVLPDDELRNRSAEQPKFSGYTKEKPLFLALCEALFQDGHLELVRKIGAQYKSGVADCPACKHFFRLIDSQCARTQRKNEKALKSKNRSSKTSAAEGESGTTSSEQEEFLRLPRKQPEPRLVVLEATLRLSQKLADDKKRLEHHLQAIQLFATELLKPEGKTPTERSYFEVLHAYLKAPFLVYEEAERRHREQQEQQEEQRRREFMFDTHQIFESTRGASQREY